MLSIKLRVFSEFIVFVCIRIFKVSYAKTTCLEPTWPRHSFNCKIMVVNTTTFSLSRDILLTDILFTLYRLLVACWFPGPLFSQQNIYCFILFPLMVCKIIPCLLLSSFLKYFPNKKSGRQINVGDDTLTHSTSEIDYFGFHLCTFMMRAF